MFHASCDTRNPFSRFRFGQRLWLCYACWVLYSRRFHAIDRSSGVSRWSFRAESRARDALSDEVSAYPVRVDASVPSNSGSFFAGAVPSSSTSMSSGASRRFRRVTKRRRVDGLSIVPSVLLPAPLGEDPVVIGSCNSLGRRAPFIWQTVFGALKTIARGVFDSDFESFASSWVDSQVRAVCSRSPDVLEVHVRSLVDRMLRRFLHFGISGVPGRIPDAGRR